ncbi:MAG: hypothetical protein GY853_13830 [PVC group bacterium]|nr:hypothetical protein [PVC group bacterium]
MSVSYGNEADAKFEKRQKTAIRRKRKHVKLILAPHQSAMKRIAGIESLNAFERYDRKSSQNTWEFTETGAGQIRWEIDENEEYSTWILYSENNKMFLASHYLANMWIIDDPVIDREIKKLHEKMAKGIKIKQECSSSLLAEINELTDELKDNVSDREAARIRAKLLRLTTEFQKECEGDVVAKPSDRLGFLKRQLKRGGLSETKRTEYERELSQLINKNDKKPEESIVTVE